MKVKAFYITGCIQLILGIICVIALDAQHYALLYQRKLKQVEFFGSKVPFGFYVDCLLAISMSCVIIIICLNMFLLIRKAKAQKQKEKQTKEYKKFRRIFLKSQKKIEKQKILSIKKFKKSFIKNQKNKEIKIETIPIKINFKEVEIIEQIQN